MPVRTRLWRPGLARRLLALQVGIVVAVVALGGVLTYLEHRHSATEQARDKVRALAEAVARIPVVVDAVAAGDPDRALPPLAESVRAGAAVDFVVVMRPDRIRLTHPNPAMIGEEFIGTTEPARRGATLTETYTGTLGPSVRAVAPVRALRDGVAGGDVLGMVSVGIVTRSIGERVAAKLPVLLAVCLLAVAAAALASLLVSRWVRRATLGLGPQEITRMYEHHDAVLHAVREGLLVLDAGGRVVLANDEAVRLLRLGDGHDGTPVDRLELPGALCRLLTSGRAAQDEPVLVGDRVIVVNRSTTRRHGQVLGTVATFRDRTELLHLARELDVVRGFAESLRARAHESANRLHTVVTLVGLGRSEEAVEFAVADLHGSRELADRLLDDVGEPALAALLLGKVAQAGERGVELVISPDSGLGRTAVGAGDLVSVVGNLVDNAVEAALAGSSPRRVQVSIREEDDLVVRVQDSGPGVAGASAEQLFRRGWSTKNAAGSPRGLGLALVEQVVRSYDGVIAVHTAAGGGAVFEVRLPRHPAGRVPS